MQINNIMIIYTRMEVIRIHLTSYLAQSIVNKMMAQIPYNINMMDENGYILASGDISRINSLHVGAVEVIEKKKTLTMKTAYGKNGLPGVNMPVFFENKVVGVIGITGDPEKVTPLASLLRVSTELLIKQEAYNKQQQQLKIDLNHFLYQWIQMTDSIENHPGLLLEAKKLNIDTTYSRFAIAIQNKNKKSLPLDKEDYEFSFSDTITIVLTSLKSSVSRFSNLTKNGTFRIGIGKPTKKIGRSVNEALRSLELGTIFSKKKVTRYNDIGFIDSLLSAKLPVNDSIFKSLDKDEKGKNLIQTLITYIKNNGNVSETAKELFIHRNTLSYRLNQINIAFKLNPKSTVDLFQLYVGLIYYIYQKSENKNALPH